MMGSLRDGLVGAGIAAPQPETPTQSWSGPVMEDAVKRLSVITELQEFCRQVRKELITWPALIEEELHPLALRFDQHPDYLTVLGWLDHLKTEMAKPEFDFSRPGRMRHWLNYTLLHAFKKAATPEAPATTA